MSLGTFVALGTIVGLDWVLSHLVFRHPRLANVIEGEVVQLVKDGVVLEDALARTRISRDELLAFLRQRGRNSLEDVQQAFLERSGRVTFILAENEST